MIMVAFLNVAAANAEEIDTAYSVEANGMKLAAIPGAFQASLPFIIGGNSPSVAGASPEMQSVLGLTNAARIAAGCSPLTLNAKLTAAAQGHALDMVQNDFFAHVGSDGATVGTRMTRQGYVWSRAGENIAAGYTDAQSVMDGWMNSSGHRANILNCAYRELGVGYVYEPTDGGSQRWRYYWVQVFGTSQ
jgi:uncharacterized protein YkwD